MQLHGSIHDLARSLGVSPAHLLERRLDFTGDPVGVRNKLAPMFRRLDSRQGQGRMDSREVLDAATSFVTSELSVLLTPTELPGLERFLFVPGKTQGQPLLPVQQKVALGMQSLEYDVIAHTGEARWVGAGGLADLRKVGSAEDRKKQDVGYFGVRFGWDQFDLWQQSHQQFRSIERERSLAAGRFMAEFLEQVIGYGNEDRKMPGMFRHGSATSLDLTKSFGAASITAAEALDQMALIELAWKRMNPRRMMSGIVMPASHRLNLISTFTGAAGEGDFTAWKLALELYPWLANITEDDRMLTASDSGTPMWVIWSADAEELYAEASATPMVFGPFENELNVDFIALNQTGGVVCKNSRLLLRVVMPAA